MAAPTPTKTTRLRRHRNQKIPHFPPEAPDKLVAVEHAVIVI